jgi:DNA-binding transcriptional MerR regulator
VTVRALHHYEAIGLLVPSARTEAGHRRYEDADVRRLYRILALRELGMSLGQSRQALDGESTELAGVLRAHLAHVEQTIERQRALRDRLARLCATLDGDVSTDDLIATIEGMVMNERYFTQEQLDTLARRREEYGEDAIADSQRDWQELAGALRAHMERGDDPTTEPVRALARRCRTLIHAFTGGDPEMYESLRRMRENEDPLAASRGLMDGDLIAYLERAMEALRRD